jgi:hypothetical protein
LRDDNVIVLTAPDPTDAEGVGETLGLTDALSASGGAFVKPDAV